VPAIDFLGRRIHVERQLITLPRKPPRLGPLKTEASQRTIPVPAFVIDALAAHLARYPAGAQELVFTSGRGRPIARRVLIRLWRDAVDAAELPPGTTFHSLRHTYASLLIQGGESVRVVQARLGHASARETLDAYSHLFPDTEDRTREVIDAAFAESPAASPRPGAVR